MAETLGRAVLRLSTDNRKLNEGLRDSKRATDKLTQGFRGLETLAGVLLVRQFVRIGFQLAKLAGDAEETRSKFDAVFKDLAAGVRAWADEQAKAVNRSAITFEGYLSTLQDTFVPLGFARKQAAELSKQLTLLGVDLASFNNVAEEETISLLTSAIVGNHEAVRRFGIIITEATLNQELLRQGFQKTTQGATEQQKVQSRLNIIMRSSGDAMGDAARTSDSFTNQVRGLNAQLKDAGIAIGEKLIPPLKRLIPFFRDVAIAAIKMAEGLDRGVRAVLELVGFDAQQNTIKLALRIAELRSQIQTLTSLPQARQDLLDAAAIRHGQAAIADLKIELEDLEAELLSIISPAEESGKAIAAVSTATAAVGAAAASAGETVKEAAGAFNESVKNLGEFAEAGEDSANAFEGLHEAMSAAVDSAREFAISDFLKSIDDLGKFGEASEEAAENLNDLLDAISTAPQETQVFGSAIEQIMAGIGDAGKELEKEMLTLRKISKRAFLDIQRAAEDAIGDGLFNAFKGGTTSIKELWEGFLDDLLRAFTRAVAQMIAQRAFQSIAGILTGGGAPTGGAPTGATTIGGGGNVSGAIAGVVEKVPIVGGIVGGIVRGVGSIFGFQHGGFFPQPTLAMIGEGGGRGEHVLNMDSPRSMSTLVDGLREALAKSGGRGDTIDLRGAFLPDQRSVDTLFRMIERHKSGRRVFGG